VQPQTGDTDVDFVSCPLHPRRPCGRGRPSRLAVWSTTPVRSGIRERAGCPSSWRVPS